MNIFALNGQPGQENVYLFNGDFIDRGSFSCEVIIALLACKVAYPQHFFMSRGNHESKNLNKIYGFEGEVIHKYDAKCYELYCDVFCQLPISHCINSKIYISHGGLFSKDGVTLKDIEETNRFREPGDEGILCESLWSDPSDLDGRHTSKRGVGIMFGPDVTKKFIEDNDLSKPNFSLVISFRIRCSLTRSQERRIRISERRQAHHSFLCAKLLRLDGQQRSIHPLQRQGIRTKNH